MSANAIETLRGGLHSIAYGTWDMQADAEIATLMEETAVALLDSDALAAVEELYEAASRLSDPTHQLTQLEWNGVMSRLRAAVARVESGQ